MIETIVALATAMAWTTTVLLAIGVILLGVVTFVWVGAFALWVILMIITGLKK